MRTVIGCRHKVEVFTSVKSLHSRIPLIEAVFASDFVAAWKVVDFLKATQVAINIRLYNRSTPNQNDLVVAQEVAICRIRYVVEVRSRHSIVLH